MGRMCYLAILTISIFHAVIMFGSILIVASYSLTSSIDCSRRIRTESTGHCDTITSFDSYTQSHGFAPESIDSTDMGRKNTRAVSDTGILTSSLDGTIRMRKLVGMCGD